MATATAPNAAADAPETEPAEGSLQEEINKPARSVFSPFILNTLDESLQKRPLSAWPTVMLESLRARAQIQIEKFDDAGGWPIDDTRPDARERAFLGGADRNESALDVRLLVFALDVRKRASASKHETEATEAPAKSAKTPKAVKTPKAPKAAPAPEKEQAELFAAVPEAAAGTTEEVIHVPIADVAPDPDQPRRDADDDLADSIRQEGVLQPLIVRPYPHRDGPQGGDFALTKDGVATKQPKYMIRYGERRYRGALKAGRATIPVIIRTEDEGRVRRLIRQNVENSSKALSALDEAKNWKELQNETGWNINQLAKALSKSKSTVSDRLALADAPAAMLELFEKGVLSPSAGPIVRKYAEVPHSVLAKVVEEADNDWQWHQAAEDGRAVALDHAERLLDQLVFRTFMCEVPADLPGYAGQIVTIKGKRYATDVEQVRRLREEKQAAADERKGNARGSRVPRLDTYQQQERERVKKAKRLGALRRAQWDAIAAKLGGASVDATVWGQFVARCVIEEMVNDSLRVACKAFGLEAPKAAHGGYNFGSSLRKYAETLTGKELSEFLIKLLLASDIPVSPYGMGSGPKRLTEAARILGINLGKIKPPEDDPVLARVKAEQKRNDRKLASKESRDRVNRRAHAEFDKRTKARASKAKKAKVRKARALPRGTFAFMKPLQPDAVLGAIVGNAPLPRTEITKKVWQYIKKHGLQDQKERQMLNADATIKPLFGGKKRVSMFELVKLVSRHFKPAPAKGGK